MVALLTVTALVFVLASPWWLGGICVAVAAGYAVARVPWRQCGRFARSLLVLVVFVFGLQWWLLGLDPTVVICLRIVAALGAANLFTVTTRVEASQEVRVAMASAVRSAAAALALQCSRLAGTRQFGLDCPWNACPRSPDGPR